MKSLCKVCCRLFGWIGCRALGPVGGRNTILAADDLADIVECEGNPPALQIACFKYSSWPFGTNVQVVNGTSWTEFVSCSKPYTGRNPGALELEIHVLDILSPSWRSTRLIVAFALTPQQAGLVAFPD